MPQRRKPSKAVSPEYEDRGLFKNGFGQISAELVPQMMRNHREDLVVRGFTNRTVEIEVAFAGRRSRETAPLEERLKAMLAQASHEAVVVGSKAPDIDQVRLPVLIEGSWRPKFMRDQAGWETRSYYLFAARWSILDNQGNTMTFGSTPLIARPDHSE